MIKSDFEHEYLFVLGNGASIASINPELSKYLQHNPSIRNYIPMLEELDGVNRRFPFALSGLMDENYFEEVKGLIGKVIEISERERERNIVKILEKYVAINWSQRNEFTLQEKTDQSMPIWIDINILENAIYHLVAACYRNYEEKYFEKLWRLVRENHSPVISLNWDINFEKIILKENPKVPMANYYGKCIFNLSPSDQKNEPYNPIVNILKPHGSLNWLIPTGIQSTFGNLNDRSNELQPAGHLRVLNEMPVDFNSEYQCFLLPPVPDEAAVDEFSGLFWRIKRAVKDDVFERIKEYAGNTRTLVIIGYSFPAEDRHIENLFMNNRFENVSVFGIDEEVFQRIQGYFPKAKHEFRKGGFADIMEWPDVGEDFKPSR